jgi:hypothetical protein
MMYWVEKIHGRMLMLLMVSQLVYSVAERFPLMLPHE